MTESPDTTAALFAPFADLARQLLPHAFDASDGSHDMAHLLRVFRNAMRIRAAEGGDAELLAAAVLLHDCVAVEKNHPRRAEASRLAAEKAAGLLAGLGWDPERIAACGHAIAAHSFSARIPPVTLEAKILQDADRLDAIGAVGAARCFYIAGRLGSKLYDPLDPQAEHRPLDDQTFAIDHFPAKLFTLRDGFQTVAGQALADERHARLVAFLDDFLTEV